MRLINRIVVHCSATREGVDFTARQIDDMHRRRGFKFSPPNAAGLGHIGYHFFYRLDGTEELGRPLERVGAHVQGYNGHSIGLCYAGGLDANGEPKDTRTPAQKAAMARRVRELVDDFKIPLARITGHRDLSPDKDGDGVVEAHEYLKQCPCFDVAGERQSWIGDPA